MYIVCDKNNNEIANFYDFLEYAIEFAKVAGYWWYIKSDDEIITTQDDYILMELSNGKS
jgi:hypothetical protein